MKGEGIVSGINEMVKVAKKLGLNLVSCVHEGAKVTNGDVIAIVRGTPKKITLAEDLLIGVIAKPSGIATAARKAIELSQGKVTIVCGAWKKMPFQIKDLVRNALMTGGVEIRMCREPFVYLDKNYVKIFGNIEKTLESVRGIKNRVKVIQVRGDTDAIEIEAVKAVKSGANIIFVDTGNLADLDRVVNALVKSGLRQMVKVAFGGAIKIEDIPMLIKKNVDILDIGRAIIDAPMLDVSFDVQCSG